MAPIRPDIDGSFAQLTPNGFSIYGRTRDGSVARWGYGSGPEALDLPIRVVDLAVGSYGYCVISETGGLYCDTSWDGKGPLRAIPATPIP